MVKYIFSPCWLSDNILQAKAGHQAAQRVVVSLVPLWVYIKITHENYATSRFVQLIKDVTDFLVHVVEIHVFVRSIAHKHQNLPARRLPLHSTNLKELFSALGGEIQWPDTETVTAPYGHPTSNILGSGELCHSIITFKMYNLVFIRSDPCFGHTDEIQRFISVNIFRVYNVTLDTTQSLTVQEEDVSN